MRALPLEEDSFLEQAKNKSEEVINRAAIEKILLSFIKYILQPLSKISATLIKQKWAFLKRPIMSFPIWCFSLPNGPNITDSKNGNLTAHLKQNQCLIHYNLA
jgi:hypothetical protein